MSFFVSSIVNTRPYEMMTLSTMTPGVLIKPDCAIAFKSVTYKTCASIPISLIAFETGEAVTYGLYNAQERGTLFIPAGTPVYEGMIVGSSAKLEDLVVNVCKKKHLTNTRASGSDDALRLVTPRRMGLEDSIEFLAEDELMEVTPKSIRLRKRILETTQRLKQQSKLK